MPDADLQRILVELRQRRERLEKLTIKRDVEEPKPADVPPVDIVDPDAT